MAARKRTEHCFFAVLSKTNGHCIAHCHHRKLVGTGITEDCMSNKSETTREYVERIEVNRKLH